MIPVLTPSFPTRRSSGRLGPPGWRAAEGAAGRRDGACALQGGWPGHVRRDGRAGAVHVLPPGGRVASHQGRQAACAGGLQCKARSEEHTTELQSLMRISYAVFCLKKKKQKITTNK